MDIDKDKEARDNAMGEMEATWNEKFKDTPYLTADRYAYKGKDTTILCLAAQVIDNVAQPFVVHMAGAVPQVTPYADFVSKYKPAKAPKAEAAPVVTKTAKKAAASATAKAVPAEAHPDVATPE